MPRRRASKVLRDKLAVPPIEQDWFVRTFVWFFRSETSSALLLCLLIALVYGVSFFLPSHGSGVREIVVTVSVLFIISMFLAVIVITDDKNFRGNAVRTRVVCGAIAGAAIVVIAPPDAPPLEGVLLGACVGAVLGFFGMSWAKYI